VATREPTATAREVAEKIARTLAQSAGVLSTEFVQRLAEKIIELARSHSNIRKIITSLREHIKYIISISRATGELLYNVADDIVKCSREGGIAEQISDTQCKQVALLDEEFLRNYILFLSKAIQKLSRKQPITRDYISCLVTTLEDLLKSFVNCFADQLAKKVASHISLEYLRDFTSCVHATTYQTLFNKLVHSFGVPREEAEYITSQIIGDIVVSLQDIVGSAIKVAEKEKPKEAGPAVRPTSFEEALGYIIYYLQEIASALRKLASETENVRRAARTAEAAIREELTETVPVRVLPMCVNTPPFRYGVPVVENFGTPHAIVLPKVLTWLTYPLYHGLRLEGFTVLGAVDYICNLARDISEGRKSLNEVVSALTEEIIRGGCNELPREVVRRIVEEYMQFVINAIVEKDIKTGFEHYIRFLEILKRYNLLSKLRSKGAYHYCLYLYYNYVCKNIALCIGDPEAEAICDRVVPP